MIRLNFKTTHLYILLFINICYTQETKYSYFGNSQKYSVDCSTKRTCGECMSNPNCAWHIKTDDDSKDHCKHAEGSTDNSIDIVNPQTEGNVEKNTEGQINIKSVNLKIRPGQSYLLNFTYKESKNYPVDMYFLMDMSKSMAHYQAKISNLSNELFEIMKQHTNDIRIGFGSFIDKTELPYVNTYPGILEKPCAECTKPYSFQNHLHLTDDVAEFSQKVKNTPISGNIDSPEATLEALMQTIVCEEQIGWRKNARRLIILSTDDQFHIAGDGKLAGIVEPNDGLCHLDKNNKYTVEHSQDYPSVGQINIKAHEKNMIIIFIVTSSQKSLYSQLGEHIKNSHLGTLDMQSENFITLITDIYKTITTAISLQNNFPKNFNIELSSNCTHFITNKCDNIHTEESIEFTAKITFNNCPEDKNFSKTYWIKHDSVTEASIAINVEMLCDCSCEHPVDANYEENSSQCSNAGTLQCGVCNCNAGKVGNKCECDAESNFQDYLNENSCIKENTTEICSGAGECICGQCNCNPPISGKYCECNNDLCRNSESDEVCSSQGACECGECKCYNDWTGEKCECTKRTDTCKLSKNSEVCSGIDYGECECGKCKCKVFGGHRYSGDYCQICTTCPKKCADFEYCVECQILNKTDCGHNCTKYEINLTEVDESDDTVCNFRDETGCLVKFSFNYISVNDTTIIQAQQICVSQATFSALLMYIASSILLAGLIFLIIWRVCATRIDALEYTKFEIEKNNAVWREENPLFRNAVTTFQNPIFARSD